jgi:hypothetical protein
VFDIDGVIETLEVGDTLGEGKVLLGVALGVIEVDGIGVVVIDGVIDGVAVMLGDTGTTRTGHSKV